MAISKPNSTVISKLDSIVEKGTDTIKKTLKRSVGLAGVVIISLSAMLPGIFVTPTFAADIMGAGIWLAFIVAAAVVLPAAISKAELSSRMPSDKRTRAMGIVFAQIRLCSDRVFGVFRCSYHLF